MKYFIIAGEASGDLHGAHLIAALKHEDQDASFVGWGGELMQAAGMSVLKHYRDLAFMGFTEVVLNLRTILSNFKTCKKQILDYQPHALILIDYPGFNLRMAKWAKRNKIHIVYYISPQIWAWHSSRAKQIKRDVDQMLVILPFEKDFYKKYQYEVDFVGHPLLDVVHDFSPPGDFRQKHAIPKDKNIIALLPGSRRQEIGRTLRIMLEVIDKFADYQFVIAAAPAIPLSFYESIIQKSNDRNSHRPIIVQHATYELLSIAKAAVVTSGTATLETALFDVPQVIVYKGSSLSFHIAKRLVQVSYISLVNLILDKPAITELIQKDFTSPKLHAALHNILQQETRHNILKDYKELKKKLGESGASKRAARKIRTRMIQIYKRG